MRIIFENIHFFIGLYAGFWLGVMAVAGWQRICDWRDQQIMKRRCATDAEIVRWMEQGKFDHLLSNQKIEKRSAAPTGLAS